MGEVPQWEYQRYATPEEAERIADIMDAIADHDGFIKAFRRERSRIIASILRRAKKAAKP